MINSRELARDVADRLCAEQVLSPAGTRTLVAASKSVAA